MITTNTLIIYDNFLIGGIQRLILDQCYEIFINGNGTSLETDHPDLTVDWIRLNKNFNASFISLISTGSGNYVSCIYIEEK